MRFRKAGNNVGLDSSLRLNLLPERLPINSHALQAGWREREERCGRVGGAYEPSLRQLLQSFRHWHADNLRVESPQLAIQIDMPAQQIRGKRFRLSYME